jgi:hypothetical protein
VDFAKVNSANWPNFTVAVPVTTWDDLQNLQVRVEEIPTTQDPVPTVYLDGMFAEVHYEIAAGPDTASSTDTLPPTRPKIVTFDPDAKQTCSVNPFSQPIAQGESGSAVVTLVPSYFNAPYDLFTGDLPSGVSASIDQPSGVGAVTPKITFSVAADAGKGSFNVVVVYEEKDIGGKIFANYCQLNLVVQ